MVFHAVFLDDATNIDDIEIGLQLSKMKPFHAGWIVQFYYLMTIVQGTQIIDNRWKATKIADGVHLGLSKLTPIDPLNYIDRF